MTETTNITSRSDDHAHLMSNLRRIYRRWRCLTLMKGLGRTFVGGTLLLTATLILDAVLGLGFVQRLIIVILFYAVLAMDMWRSWLRDVLKPYSARNIAWILERQIPSMNERLITAVELTEAQNEHLSVALIAHTIEQINVDLKQCAPERMFKIPWQQFILPGAGVLAFLLVLLIPEIHLPVRLDRILLPSTADPVLHGTRYIRLITPRTGQFVEGDRITAAIYTNYPAQDYPVRILVKTDRLIPYTAEKSERKNIHTVSLPAPDQPFSMWARYGETKSRTYHISAIARPKVEQFDIHCHYPEYTGQPVKRLTQSTADIRVVQGTSIKLAARFTKPVESAVLELNNRQIKGTLSQDALTGVFKFEVHSDSEAQLYITDRQGLTPDRDLIYQVKGLADQPPEISIDLPAVDLNAGKQEAISFEWSSTDDYAVTGHSFRVFKPDNDVLKTINLPGTSNRLTLDLRQFTLSPGQVVAVSISAVDGRGQTAVTEPRHIVIAAENTVADTTRLLDVLTELNAALQEAAQIAVNFKLALSAAGRPDHPWETGAQHYANLVQNQKEKLRIRLLNAHERLEHIKRNRVLAQARLAGGIAQKYIEQQLLVWLPAIQEPDGDALGNADNVTTAIENLLELTRAITEKTVQFKAERELPLLARTLQQSTTLPPQQQRRLMQTVAGNARRLWTNYEVALPKPLEQMPDYIDTGKANAEMQNLQRLLRLAIQLVNRRIQDNSRINAALQEMTRNIVPVDEHLSTLSHAGSNSENTNAYWQILQESGEAYLRLADAAAHESPPTKRVLIGEALKRAADLRSPIIVSHLLPVLSELENHQRLQAFDGKFKRLQSELLDIKDPIQTNRSMLESDDSDTQSRLQKARHQINILKAELETLETFRTPTSPEEIDRDISSAHSKIVSAGQSIHKTADSRRPEVIITAIDEAFKALGEAADDMERGLQRQQKPVRQALIQLRELLKNPPRQIREIKKEIAKLSTEYREKALYNPGTIRQLQEYIAEIERMSHRFRGQALEQFSSPESDLYAIYEELLISRHLQDIADGHLQPVIDGLRQRLRATAMESSVIPEADGAAQRLVNEADTTRGRLAESATRLTQAQKLLSAYEQNRFAPSPHQERVSYIRKLAADNDLNIAPATLAALDTVHTVRNATSSLTQKPATPQPDRSQKELIANHLRDLIARTAPETLRLRAVRRSLYAVHELENFQQQLRDLEVAVKHKNPSEMAPAIEALKAAIPLLRQNIQQADKAAGTAGASTSANPFIFNREIAQQVAKLPDNPAASPESFAVIHEIVVAAGRLQARLLARLPRIPRTPPAYPAPPNPGSTPFCSKETIEHVQDLQTLTRQAQWAAAATKDRRDSVSVAIQQARDELLWIASDLTDPDMAENTRHAAGELAEQEIENARQFVEACLEQADNLPFFLKYFEQLADTLDNIRNDRQYVESMHRKMQSERRALLTLADRIKTNLQQCREPIIRDACNKNLTLFADFISLNRFGLAADVVDVLYQNLLTARLRIPDTPGVSGWLTQYDASQRPPAGRPEEFENSGQPDIPGRLREAGLRVQIGAGYEATLNDVTGNFSGSRQALQAALKGDLNQAAEHAFSEGVKAFADAGRTAAGDKSPGQPATHTRLPYAHPPRSTGTENPIPDFMVDNTPLMDTLRSIQLRHTEDETPGIKELTEGAAESLKARQFTDAARQLDCAVALHPDPSRKTEIQALATALRAESEQWYGAAHDLARTALQKIPPAEAEIYISARKLDYDKAAELAARQGFEYEADLFRKAQIQVTAEAPAAVRRAATLLHQGANLALAAGRPQTAHQLRLAHRTAIHLRLAAAADISRTAVEDRLTLARLVEKLKAIQHRKKSHAEPLVHILETTRQNHFRTALLELQGLPEDFPEAMRQELQKAADAVDAVIAGASRDAYRYPPGQTAHTALEKAARMIGQGKFRAAAAKAAEAGTAGRKAVDALTRLEAFGETAARRIHAYLDETRREIRGREMEVAETVSRRDLMYFARHQTGNDVDISPNLIHTVQYALETSDLESALQYAQQAAAEAWPAYQAAKQLEAIRPGKKPSPTPSNMPATPPVASRQTGAPRTDLIWERIAIALDALQPTPGQQGEVDRAVIKQLLEEARITGLAAGMHSYAATSSDQGTAYPPSPASVPDIAQAEILRPWLGITNLLREQNLGLKSQTYDTYFNEPNRQYLEALAREGRKWHSSESDKR